MINSIPYYPYQQNVQILKGFFSKPLTLICAIVSGLTCIFGMFSINTRAGSTNISFSSGTGGSISILLCIALILLYAKCRSNDPMPFGATVTLIKIYSIIARLYRDNFSSCISFAGTGSIRIHSYPLHLCYSSCTCNTHTRYRIAFMV